MYGYRCRSFFSFMFTTFFLPLVSANLWSAVTHGYRYRSICFVDMEPSLVSLVS